MLELEFEAKVLVIGLFTFILFKGRALCHECNAKVKADGLGKYMCQKCHSVVDGEPLRFRGEVYHPYHFNCTGNYIIYI